MRTVIVLAESGLQSLLIYRLRTGVILLCLICVQTPYLVGLALSQGLLDEAENTIDAGADLYISATSAGREAMLPLTVSRRISEVHGVEKVVERIVGSASMGKNAIEAVVVGIKPGLLPASLVCVEGRWFQDGPVHEIVVGRDLADSLRLQVGDVLPPFYNSRRGDHLVKVVGVFRSEVSLWQSRLLLTSFESAAEILDTHGACSDLLVYARPGYAELLASTVRSRDFTEHESPTLRLVSLTREEARRFLPAGGAVRQSALTFYLLPALALGASVVLLAAGLGDYERRREIGILKALGWQTDQVLVRGAVESLTLSITAASVSLLVTWLWLRVGNGFGIAALFFPPTDIVPSYRVPSRLPPPAILVAFVISTVLVLVPSLWSSWRTAIADPSEAMR